MNAVNFVDGLDGLAAGVVGIGAAAFFLYCYMVSDRNDLTLATTGALLSAALAGACAGFLPHNFHPARLFMGDSGSMLIGLVLSASTLTLTGQFVGMPTTEGNPLFVTVLPVLLPISLLMVPIVDLVLAVVRRTRAGRSPMSADKQHLHHRLLEIGHSQRRAVLIMWLWAFTLATGAVIVSLFDEAWVWWALGSMLAITVAMTFVLPQVNRPRKTGLGDTGLPENAVVEGRAEPASDGPGEPLAGP
jgi:UDP-GlcNAc:undecaprenyl-phosphate GlcNAc-1-phosphate transferase